MYLPSASNATAVALGALAATENTRRGVVVPIERRSQKTVFGSKQDAINTLQKIGMQNVYKYAQGALNYHQNTGEDSVFLSSSAATELLKEAEKKLGLNKRAASVTGVLTSQEGYYTGVLNFGSNNQAMDIDFDTGSADIWVPLKSEKGGETYDPHTSSTGHDQGRKYSLSYGDGSSATCEVWDDNLSFQGLSVRQTFGVAADTTVSLKGGLAGMAWTSISAAKASMYVENLFHAGLIPSNVFSFNLKQGTLELGGIDHSAYKGQLIYQKLVEKSYWGVKDMNIWHHGISLFNPFQTIVDSGTTGYVLPLSVATQFWTLFPVAVPMLVQFPTVFWIYPCGETFGPIELSFGKLRVPFSSDDLSLGKIADGLCIGSIYGQLSFPNTLSIAGDVFMDKVYTVFDYENAQVGVAIAN